MPKVIRLSSRVDAKGIKSWQSNDTGSCGGEENQPRMKIGFFEASGADRVRTDDLLHAMQALSQLSYGPQYFLQCCV